jgi:sugar/nucleoside kinase (ribokinase family)
VAYCGVVGDDAFGHRLRALLEDDGVDCRALRHTRAARTGICFLSVDGAGQRRFFGAERGSADVLVSPADAHRAPRARALAFVAGPLRRGAGRAAVATLTERIRDTGGWIAADPNPRPHQWRCRRTMVERTLGAVRGIDVLKCSDEEAGWLAGSDGAAAVRGRAHTAVAVVTRGPAGASCSGPAGELTVPAPPVEALDTTGAGDAFMGALLARLLDTGTPPAELGANRWADALTAANAAGAETCTRMGAGPR